MLDFWLATTLGAAFIGISGFGLALITVVPL